VVIGEPVVRVRAPEVTDARGNPARDWSDADEVTITGAAVAPRFEGSLTGAVRDGRIVGLTVYLPAGADVVATDRMVVRGESYRIESDPGDWRQPWSGRAVGVTVQLVRVEG
jgi:hypothetical protein